MKAIRRDGRGRDSRRVSSRADPQARYDFLYDDEALNKRLEEEGSVSANPVSHLLRRLPRVYRRYTESHGLDGSLLTQSRLSEEDFRERSARAWFAATERVRELSGTVELFHSMYYADPTVVKHIANFIATGAAPPA